VKLEWSPFPKHINEHKPAKLGGVGWRAAICRMRAHGLDGNRRWEADVNLAIFAAIRRASSRL